MEPPGGTDHEIIDVIPRGAGLIERATDEALKDKAQLSKLANRIDIDSLAGQRRHFPCRKIDSALEFVLPGVILDKASSLLVDFVLPRKQIPCLEETLNSLKQLHLIRETAGSR